MPKWIVFLLCCPSLLATSALADHRGNPTTVRSDGDPILLPSPVGSPSVEAQQHGQIGFTMSDSGGESCCSPCGPTCGVAPPRPQPFVFVDYLYWKPYRQGLDFAIVDPGSADAISGEVAHVTLGSESGVRGGLGYRFPTGWDIVFSYTNFHSRGDNQVSGFVRATASHPAFNFDAEQAAAAANLEYNVFDLEIGRMFLVDETLAIRLLAGVRTARMQERFQIRYSGLDFNGGVVEDAIDFDGVGLRVGGEARWNLFFGWSLMGRAAASLLTGQFDTRLFEADAVGVLVNVTDHMQQVVPVTELAFGMSWQGRQWHLDAGYEVSNWFNMLERPVFHDDVDVASFSRRQGDLALAGLFLRLCHQW